jgi:hypothetical protein
MYSAAWHSITKRTHRDLESALLTLANAPRPITTEKMAYRKWSFFGRNRRVLTSGQITRLPFGSVLGVDGRSLTGVRVVEDSTATWNKG